MLISYSNKQIQCSDKAVNLIMTDLTPWNEAITDFVKVKLIKDF